MTPKEAVGFLTEAAWKEHKVGYGGVPDGGPGSYGRGSMPDLSKSCKALTQDKLGRFVVQDESRCNCGAVAHNAKVKEALMTIGGAARRQTVVK